jgi:hypothetical protein
MKKLLLSFCLLFVLAAVAFAQAVPEKIDSAAFAQIRDEGMNRSGVMDILSTLCDVYGPRLTGSPGYERAALWAQSKLTSMGLENAHLETWGPFGRGWELKRYSANVIGRQNFPLFSYPRAWSPGTGGSQTGEVIYLDATTDSALQTFRGKLKGKFVLLSDPREIKAHFLPEAERDADSTLLMLANADAPGARRGSGRRFEMNPAQKARALVEYQKLEMCQKEGALGLLTISRGDGGNIFVQQASVPSHPDTPFTKRVSAWDPKAPKILPQIAVAAEHYNRLIRMLKKGEAPKLEISLDVNFTKSDSEYNILAEIPGTDLKDEVVMLGGHFDSWHGGTGATDDGTGTAVCMEAMRILKALKFAPRRTIRIGLWGGEEQGLLGSAGYVKRHFGESVDGAVTQMPAAEKFSVYFNNDNGSGKVRGVYMQGNDAVRPIFRSWLKPFADMGASTLTLSNTGGTDHLSFDAVGLPGFQFIQDPLEYDTRTHHSTMDVYERVQEEDVKQASVIMAAFVYQAAMRDEKFPRKPLPQPARTPGSN